MPGQEETDEKSKILNLDPHPDELLEGYGGSLVLNRQGGQAEGEDHDQLVKKLEGFE